MSSAPTEGQEGTTDDDVTSPRHRARRPRTPSAFAVVFTLAVLVFLAVRLGPSLVGARVFAGADVLGQFPPWSHLPWADGPLRTSLYVTDQFDSTFPAMHEVRERLLRGDLPWWSTMVSGGLALLGTTNFGMITPGRALFLVLPTSLAPAWSKLVEMGFAATFTYLLVRRLGGSRAAGALAGFVYPMTGFIIGWTNWTQTAVASVIPMLFWAIERFAQERRLTDLAPVSVATALLLFGGFPAVAGQALYLAAGYALVRLVALTWGRRHVVGGVLKDGLLLVGAVLLGIGLSAVQLLPFLTQTLGDVDLSYREGWFYDQALIQYTLTSIFPESFAANEITLMAEGAEAPSSPIDLNTYVGGVVLLLATLGLLQVRRMARARSALVYFVLVAVLVVALVWFQGAWSAWLGDLPVFSGNPIGRIRSQLGLPAAVLAAAGVDWILSARARSTGAGRVESWLGAGLAAAVTALAAVGGALLLTGRLHGLSENVERDVVATLIPMLVVTAFVAAQARVPTRGGATLAVAAAAVVLQAFPATAYYWPTAPRERFFPVTEGISLLQENVGHDRVATLGHAIRPNATQYYGIRVLNGHVFAPTVVKEVFEAIDPGSFIGPTYSIFSPEVTAVAASPGLDRYAVRYLVAQADSVRPGMPGVPVAIPGPESTVPPVASSGDLPVGGIYVTEVPAGDLRGLHIPLEVGGATTLTVELRDHDGELVAENRRELQPTAGLQDVPVALAVPVTAAADAPVGTTWTATVVVEEGEVAGTFDARGALRVAAVRDHPEGSAEDDGLSVAFAGEGMIIWERDGYLPRIRWAQEARVIEDEERRVEAVATSPARPGEVILDELPQDAPRVGSGARSDDGAQLEVLEDSGDVVRVRTRSSAPGFVVVSDAIQLDFAATVDGIPADILAADHAGGAVVVPAGDHVVEVRYAAPEQRVGAVVSALSLLGLVSLLVVPPFVRRSRRRRVPTEPA